MSRDDGGQAAVMALLSDPASFGLPPETKVHRIDTHAAAIFLAGDRAFKVKKAIKLPFLDFSTLELRERACRNELDLNTRTAPDLYLGLRPVTCEANGALAYDGEGEPVDWVVEMRRFPDDALLDRVAMDGRLSMPMLDRLADAIARFHMTAERYDDDAPAEYARLAAVNADRFRAFAGGTFACDAVDRVIARTEEWVARLSAQLDERCAAGFVRHCHGDLHLRNIFLDGETPTLFDAVEFDDRLARSDVAYDLAFLLMDLWHRGLRDEANRVMNRYLLRTGDYEALGPMPLFLSLRAGIRAHVSATMAESADDPGPPAEEARQYLKLAEDFLSPRPAMLVAVGGFSGSGKSSLSRRLAPRLGPAPGAVSLRTDELRKLMHGVEPEETLPKSAYTRSVSARVYGDVRARAKRVLAQGHAAIADAVHNLPQGRAEIAGVARESGVPFQGFWLSAPEATLAARIQARRGDASDADVAVMRRQLRNGAGTMEWTVLDAGGCLEDTVRTALNELPPRSVDPIGDAND